MTASTAISVTILLNWQYNLKRLHRAGCPEQLSALRGQSSPEPLDSFLVCSHNKNSAMIQHAA